MNDELRKRMSPLSDRRNSLAKPRANRVAQAHPGRNRPSNDIVFNTVGQPAETSISVAPKKARTPRALLKRRRLIVGVIIFIIFIALFCVYLFVFSNKSVAAKKEPSIVANLSKPNFTPLVPQDESQLAHLNSATSFNKAHDSYAFDDLYLGVPIQVSEQPMPSNDNSSLTSSGVMASLVKQYGANTTINFKSGTAYLANISSTNKQLIIFNEKGILVFLQSSMNIKASDWEGYIDSLYQP